MSSLTITIDGTIIVVRGFKAGTRLRASDCRAMYSTPLAGWMLDRHRLPDLLAWLESRNIAVTVVDPDRPEIDFDGGDAA